MKQEKRANQSTHKEPISETVFYQYKEVNGKRTDEGLIASGRYYPGVLVHNRFYYGLHRNERFIPGIIWNESFVPGLVTKRGFFPGIVTNKGFQFGIIATGIFMPGIVVGSNFVPGLVRGDHFIPGCHTNEGHYLHGRFLKGLFECGVVDSKTRSFISTNYETIQPKVAIDLIKEGYGIKKVRRYETIGGIPLSGVGQGVFNGGIGILPSGFITNKWTIIGGLPNNKKDLPHADIRHELEELGLDTSDLGVEGWSSTQDEWEGLAYGLIDGAPGNLFGDGRGDGNALVGALDALGKGESGLIESLNRDYNEYWGSVIDSIKSIGGMIHGENGEGESQGSGAGESQGSGGNSNSKAYKLAEMVTAATIGYFLGKGLDIGFGLIKTKMKGKGPGILLVPMKELEKWNTPSGGEGGDTAAPVDDEGGVSEVTCLPLAVED